MKRAKLLSLFLAGSLLFQTAGIDAMATAPSDLAPISETVEDAGADLSEQPAEEESGSEESIEESSPEQAPDGEEEKAPAGEEENPGQSAEGEEEKPPVEEEANPGQPAEDEDGKTPVEEETDPEQPAGSEEVKDPVEEAPDLPPGNEGTEEDPVEDETEDGETVSENTVSENTISENTLPENETSLFSIFPGLGDDYTFSAKQLEDKKVLAAHVGDIVRVKSKETATVAAYADAEDKYVLDEVVYLADTEEEALKDLAS